jgi:hypothetical protein
MRGPRTRTSDLGMRMSGGKGSAWMQTVGCGSVDDHVLIDLPSTPRVLLHWPHFGGQSPREW